MQASEEEIDFCVELNERTKELHEESDKIINSRLAIVLTDQRSYAGAIGDFYFLFKKIEDLIDQHNDNEHLKDILPDNFRRTKAIEKDLQFFIGEDWKHVVEPSEIVQAYCDHLDELVMENPSFLIAYIHSMYLALVAGGAILRGIIKRTLGLGEEGLAIFDIDFGPSRDGARTAARTAFKDHINQLKIARGVKERIVEEKRKCFGFNNALANNAAKQDVNAYTRLAVILCGVLAFVTAALVGTGYTVFKIYMARS